MKKNLILIAINRGWFINNLAILGLFFSLSLNLYSQSVNETLTAEIDIFSDTKIEIEGPAVKLFGTGTIDTRHSREQFRIAGKNDNEPILILDNRLNIHTWDQSSVKVEHELSFEMNDGANKDELLTDLKPTLNINAANALSIAFFSNLESLEIENGWFKSENSRLHFKNGNIHGIEFLAIKTTIYLPKASDLSIQGNRMQLIMPFRKLKIKA